MSWFYDDYDEIVEDPSLADEIIAEAKSKLEALVKDEVKEFMNEAKEAEAKLTTLNAKIEQKKRELELTESKLQDAIRKADSEELNMPHRYADKLVRMYTKNFAPGDTAWVIEDTFTYPQCPICDGKKKIPAVVGTEEIMCTCPKCSGSGRVTLSGYKIEERKIKEIDLRLTFNGNDSRYPVTWKADTISLYGVVGWRKVDSMFKTKEEAEAALKERQEAEASNE